jgi:hypothetical protein
MCHILQSPSHLEEIIKTKQTMKKTWFHLLIVLFAVYTYARIIPPNDNNIQYSGRFDLSQSETVVQYDWSGVSFSISFSNSATLPSLLLKECGNSYNVYYKEENEEPVVLFLIGGRDNSVTEYKLSADLDPSKKYVLTVERRTEAYFGISQFAGFIVDDNVQLHRSEPAKGLKIEFIGASVTCGFGNEGVPPCSNNNKTENAHYSFGAITARNLNADYNIICWAGLGLVRNNGDKKQKSEHPMPFYYNRTVGNAAPLWNFSQFIPQIVVIQLGGNDYSTLPHPTDEDFAAAYNALMDQIKTYYGPQVRIYLGDGPLTKVPNLEKIAQDRKDDTIRYVSLFALTEKDDYGCGGHPSVKGTMKIAQKLTDFILSHF